MDKAVKFVKKLGFDDFDSFEYSGTNYPNA